MRPTTRAENAAIAMTPTERAENAAIAMRSRDFDYCDRGVCNYGGSAIGLRVPVGISFDFNRVPLDIFIQLVPVIDFVNGDYYDRYRDRAHFGVDLSAGIRYWFK